jgi:hypothetical protein
MHRMWIFSVFKEINETQKTYSIESSRIKIPIMLITMFFFSFSFFFWIKMFWVFRSYYAFILFLLYQVLLFFYYYSI